MAAERNWKHPSRHTPFGAGTGQGKIIKVGADWSGAAFVWAFATTTNGTPSGGTTGFTINAAAAGIQGVSAVYDPNYVHPKTGMVVGATLITPQIDEATLEGLTYTGTADLVLYYDLNVTPTGQPQRTLAYGTLSIRQAIGD